MLKDFELSWRFMDSNYNLLPETDLNMICEVPLNKCKLLWGKYNLHKLFNNKNFIDYQKIDKYLLIKDCFWGEENENSTRNILSKLSFDNEIVFFWAEDCAVSTTYNIFVKYWSDFCYPSDYKSIIVCINKFVLVYKEDVIFKLPWEFFI